MVGAKYDIITYVTGYYSIYNSHIYSYTPPSLSWSDMNNVTAGPLGEHTACWGTCTGMHAG